MIYTTTTTYDDAAHSVTVTDPRGTRIVTRLDGLDRPVEQTVDPGGLALVTRTAYDGLGNRKSVVDPNDHETRFRHDGLGRLVEITDPAEQPMTYAYDGEGLKTSETDRRGITRRLHLRQPGPPPHRGPRRDAALRRALAPGDPVPRPRAPAHRDERPRLRHDLRPRRPRPRRPGDRRPRASSGPSPGTASTRPRRPTSETPRAAATTPPHVRVRRAQPAEEGDGPPRPGGRDDSTRTRSTGGRRPTSAGSARVTQLDPLGRVVSVTRGLGTPDEAVLETNALRRQLQPDRSRPTPRVERPASTYDAANRVELRTDGFGTPVAADTRYRYDGVGNVLEEQDARAAASASRGRSGAPTTR